MELLLDSNRKMEVNISNIKLDMSRFSRNLVLLLVTIIWQSSLGTTYALADLSNAISVNLSLNGYAKFNNGLLVQWGRVGGSSTASYSVTMPTSFYNTEYKIFATVYKPSSDSAVYSSSPLAINKTVSRFYLNRNYASGGTTGLSQESWDWFAIGRWK
ncbi:gp53-like domain-containing protein [Bacteroides ovatus]|jgi:hypothetical protein|uniref:gp53-like domain-containing protein n=3 Tax=Bacteroides ovatus TaxID=28116 RepID=UPI0035BC6C83